MNTIETSFVTLTKRYYESIVSQDFGWINDSLGTDIAFLSPFYEISGKEAVMEVIQKFSEMINDIHIRSIMADDSQVMLAYDVVFKLPYGKERAAALISFQDQKIVHIELFFDRKPFDK